jgi:hypothetical protein
VGVWVEVVVAVSVEVGNVVEEYILQPDSNKVKMKIK